MSNKKKGKGKSKPQGRYQGAPQLPGQPRSKPDPLRRLQAQFDKAQLAFEAGDYEKTIGILEPLADRFPDNPEVLELLGLAYSQLEDYESALENFERFIHLTEQTGQPHSMEYFNLANLYSLNSYPLLSFEQLGKVNWDDVAAEMDAPPELRDLYKAVERSIDAMAAEAGQSRDEFMRANLPLERGNLALQRNDPAAARAEFEAARDLSPNAPGPYNSLAQAALAEGQTEQALEYCRYVLENLDPENIAALTTAIELYRMRGEHEQAQSLYDPVKDKPVATAEDAHNLSHLHVLMENDQAVLAVARRYFEEDDRTGEEAHQAERPEMALFGAVAAAHLGRRDEALQFLDRLAEDEADVQIMRTREALEQGEEGPRPGGRFYYTSPLEGEAGFRVFEQLSALIMAEPPDEDDPGDPGVSDRLDEQTQEAINYVQWLNLELPEDAD